MVGTLLSSRWDAESVILESDNDLSCFPTGSTVLQEQLAKELFRYGKYWRDYRESGDRVIFTETALSTNGASCSAELTVKPHGFVSGEHTHPKQEETSKVTKGTVRFRINGKEADAQVGQQVVIPAGTLHSWWNASEEEVVTRVTFGPALKTEAFFETFFGFAHDGKTNAHGMPKLLPAAVLFSAYKEEIQFPAPLPVHILLKMVLPLA